MLLNSAILCSKLKNGLCNVVTKSQVVTNFHVTKSRFHCTYFNFTKAHSLSKKFCTMICFSKNEQLMSALAGWKGLVRMICFSKNEDRADMFTQ